MCRAPLPAALRGKTGRRAPVVDHLRPWRLRPDLAHDLTNLQLICRACHATCESIEAAHWPDADMIAAAKARAGERWG
ncbi:HNH endonuclease [Sagittula sp. MA-2]|uniref:HNH endonuclease n=1 Tax=Sagittula sp. MA-2 TaxID=3048007 RepID=UPI00358E123C